MNTKTASESPAPSTRLHHIPAAGIAQARATLDALGITAEQIDGSLHRFTFPDDEALIVFKAMRHELVAQMRHKRNSLFCPSLREF